MNFRYAVILKHINSKIPNKKEKKKIEHRFPNPLIQKWSATSVSTNRIASIQIRTGRKGDGQTAAGNEAKSQIEHSQYRLAPILKHINFRIVKKKERRKIEHRFPNPLIQKWSATSVSTNRIASIQIRTGQKGGGQTGAGNDARSQIEHLCSQFRLAPRVEHHRSCDPQPWWLSAVEYIHDGLFGKCRSRWEGYAS